jgi:predicted nucleic acid-binding protein
MSKYVLDSWAWIEYFEGSTKGDKVKEIIIDPRNEIFTHCVSAAEIISKAKRTGKDIDSVWTAMSVNSNIIEPTIEDTKKVGVTHALTKSKYRNFSLADAFVLATARKMNATVVTGDPDFKNIDEAVLLK